MPTSERVLEPRRRVGQHKLALVLEENLEVQLDRSLEHVLVELVLRRNPSGNKSLPRVPTSADWIAWYKRQLPLSQFA